MAHRPLVLLTLALAACESGPPRSTSTPAEASVARSLAQDVAVRAQEERPGDAHAALAGFLGDWLVTVQSAGRDVGGGTARVSWVHDRLFQRWEQDLEIAGARVTATGFLGHSAEVGAYQALWLSDLSSAMVLLEGGGDPTRAGIVLRGASASAVGRRVMRTTGPQQFVVETWGPDDTGEERLLRRSLYRRAPQGDVTK